MGTVPPHPIPSHPIPSNKNNWTPFGLCSAESLRGIKSLIFKITPGKCVSKANFYTHQKKSHVPTVILKFLTTTPNLTSNFEAASPQASDCTSQFVTWFHLVNIL